MSPARARYEAACIERGIPVIEVSPKVAKECRGFGKLPTFPEPKGKDIDRMYASAMAARA